MYIRIVFEVLSVQELDRTQQVDLHSKHHIQFCYFIPSIYYN